MPISTAPCSDGNTWAPQQIIGGVGTYARPALAWWGTRLYAIWVGDPGDIRVYLSSSDGATWEPQTFLNGATTSVAPALATAFNGSLIAAWRGPPRGKGYDQALYFSGGSLGVRWRPPPRWTPHS